MRFLVFSGLFFLVVIAAADVPGVPKVATPAERWLNPPAQSECQAPVAAPAIGAVSRGPFSLSLAAGTVDQKDDVYKGLSGIPTTDDDGKPVVVLQRMDRESMRLEAGAGMQVGIPDAPMNLTFVIHNRTRMAASFPGDTTSQRLWGGNPLADDPVATDNTMLGNGQMLTEAGLTLGQSFGEGGNPFNVNAAFTARRQDLYQYDVPMEQGYSVLYAEDYGLNEEQGFNLDAGVTKTIRGFDLAVNVANLFPRGMGQDADVHGLKTTASVATTVNCGFSTAQLNLDWNARTGIGDTPNQRYATAMMAFGGEPADDDRTRVHLGYRRDLVDSLASMTSLGIGFSPLDALDLDISGTKARSGAYGIMAELGFKLR